MTLLLLRVEGQPVREDVQRQRQVLGRDLQLVAKEVEEDELDGDDDREE